LAEERQSNGNNLIASPSGFAAGWDAGLKPRSNPKGKNKNKNKNKKQKQEQKQMRGFFASLRMTS
jgi:hypothetical protein